MTKVYYAVWGYFAFGVVDSYERALRIKQYVHKFGCKKFCSFLQAETFAKSKAYDIFSMNYIIPKDLKLNTVLFRKNLETII